MSQPVTLTIDDLNVFPESYFVARASFLERSKACPQLETQLSIAVSAAADLKTTALASEIAWLGPADADKVLVLISATHGVEGFAGAAVQNDLFARIATGYALPADCAVLLVFALNPYGFAHYRRCDEQGIDLNRNFVDFSQPLPANPGYQRLQDAIYSDDRREREQIFQRYAKDWGQTEFEVAISGGQYSDPQGPFFGGHEVAHGRRVIEQLSEHFQLASRELAVVDLHTGLGAYGHGEIINDHPPESAAYGIARRWYGASVTAPAMGTSSSVLKQGLLDYHWHAFMAERGCCVTLEFGSYATERLFEVILQDHRVWQQADTEAITASAKAMFEHFCPEDSYWRELVLIKSRQVIQQALDGLHHG